jgi:hypothetical protein
MELVAIDPGETTGWARLMNGSPVEMGELSKYEFFDWLDLQHPDQFLYENYLIRPAPVAKGFQHNFNKGEALRQIGAVQFHCRRLAIPIDHQEPGILEPACHLFGLPYPKQGVPARNAIAAMLHARFWWHKNGSNCKTRL